MFSQSQTDLCQSVCLSESEVPILIETLEVVSLKWEQIGTALCLPRSIYLPSRRLSNCSHINVLHWIQRNQPTETTLKKLILELESLPVGRGRVAQEMVDNFTPAKRALAAKRPLVAKRPLAARSQDSLLPEKKQIIDLYSGCQEIPARSWPPVGAATFINLTHISKLGTGDYNYSIRRDMDDIIGNEEKVEYDKVFGQCESGALMLMEGCPSSGKTTLVHIVTRDWATTGNVWRCANMVFLISLRNLSKGNNESLTHILAIFYRHQEDHKKLFSDMRSNGDGVCFIIDGLSEYQHQNESTSVFHALLQKMYLPKEMVVMVSHPVATAKPQYKAPVIKQIEVLGITQQQIFEYIGKVPFSTDISNLGTYLDLHRNMLYMCYLPVHAAVIFYQYQAKGDILPTETNIYEHFTRYIVVRKLTYSNEYAQLRSLEHLRGKDKEYIRNICHLAFDMTIHSKQVAHHCDTEVPLMCELGSNDAPSLSLVTIDNTAQGYGRDNTYTFLHLTFEDYLAACYLAILGKKQKMKLVRFYAGEEHVDALEVLFWHCEVWRQRSSNTANYEVCRSLVQAQCAYDESQQAVACDHAMGKAGVLLSFTADLTAVGYAISTTSHPVTELAMSQCDLHVDHIRVLLRQVSNNKMKCIQTLNLSWNNIGDDGAVVLAEAIKSCNNQQTVDLPAALAEALRFCNNRKHWTSQITILVLMV